MTIKEFFDKYKTQHYLDKCSLCGQMPDYLLMVGDWEDIGSPAGHICADCFMELE